LVKRRPRWLETRSGESRRLLRLFTVVLAGAGAGREARNASPSSEATRGAIASRVLDAGTTTFGSASYDIEGAGGFTRTGTLDVSHSATLTVLGHEHLRRDCARDDSRVGASHVSRGSEPG
jgi:hypothetical protein